MIFIYLIIFVVVANTGDQSIPISSNQNFATSTASTTRQVSELDSS